VTSTSSQQAQNTDAQGIFVVIFAVPKSPYARGDVCVCCLFVLVFLFVPPYGEYMLWIPLGDSGEVIQTATEVILVRLSNFLAPIYATYAASID